MNITVTIEAFGLKETNETKDVTPFSLELEARSLATFNMLRIIEQMEKIHDGEVEQVAQGYSWPNPFGDCALDDLVEAKAEKEGSK